jgi:DNA-binding NarL/FixJ family response regulator
MTEPIRVVLVDDHPLYREGLAQALADVDDIDVVASAGDGAEAMAVVESTSPDVVVMDLSMPVVDGLTATRMLVSRHPHLGILVLTMSDTDETVFEAMRAGARGYVLKGARQEEVARAIRAVGAGEALFGPSVAQRVQAYFSQLTAVAPDPAAAFPELTAREREILSLIAEGRNNQSIASELFLSPKTVRNNVSNIFAKLQVADRAEAIVRARTAGLGLRANERG